MAEHGPLLRPDLALVLVIAGAACAPLPQIDGEEDARDGEREQRLDDRAADAAVGERGYCPSESSHSPQIV